MEWMTLSPCPSDMREAADVPLKNTGMYGEKVYEFVMYTLPGKEALRNEKNRTL